MLKRLVTWPVSGSLAALLCACGGGGGSGGGSSSAASAVTVTPTDVLTYHNDTLRTGQNLTETALAPGNVRSSSFGLLHVLSADAAVDATPLVVSKLSISGTTHNVVYVASENDTVYAYDADSFALLAQVSLLSAGESAATAQTGCPDVSPAIGITATPVIDRAAGPNGTLFVVAMSQDVSGNAIHRLHALDLVTLADRMTPITIQATYPGGGPNSNNGTLTFDPKQYKERGALLLSAGQLYTTWASNCDISPYNSWIISYAEASLAQTQVLNLTPNGDSGAIWNTGGMLADGSGALYAALANGTFDSAQDFGNAAVKLASSGTSLTVTDYFTPMDTATASAEDHDFGSGSPIALPDQLDASGGQRQLMLTGTKDGNLFVLDRNNLGKFSPTGNQVYQQMLGAFPNGMWSAPAYFNGSVYLAAAGLPLYAYVFNKGQIPMNPSSQSATSFAYPGTSPAVSANGSSNGIVWAIESALGSPAVLHAYNPANLAVEYYNSKQAANARDAFGNGNKFITPVIASGKVFIGTPTGVAVFGLL